MTYTIKPLDVMLLEAYQNKDKGAATKILNELRKNPKQKMLYALVDNLKNGSVPLVDIDNFINENIEMAKSLQINKLKPLFENKVSSKTEEQPTEPIVQAITTLLFEGKTALNMSEYYKSFALVREHLTSINSKDNLFTEDLKSFDQEYSNLDEADKVIVESLFKTPHSQRASIFENLAKDCTDILSENIKNTNSTTEKLKLYEVKDTISSYKIEDENFIENLLQLHELKKELTLLT